MVRYLSLSFLAFLFCINMCRFGLKNIFKNVSSFVGYVFCGDVFQALTQLSGNWVRDHECTQVLNYAGIVCFLQCHAYQISEITVFFASFLFELCFQDYLIKI